MSILPPETKFALHTQGVLHPWLHLAAFAVLALLLVLGAPSPKLRVLLSLVVVLFGLGTEIAEHFVNDTPLETSDVFADTVGATLGLLELFAQRGIHQQTFERIGQQGRIAVRKQ